MPALPGMQSDVYFGDAERELPDWRAEPSEEADDSEEPTEEEAAAVAAILGFDPMKETPAS